MRRSEKRIKPVVHDLIARGCLTVLASEGGCGKTTMAYRMAAAIIEGEDFAGTFPTEQGNVVIVSGEEDDVLASSKMRDMGVEDLEDRIRWQWEWAPSMLKELRTWVREHKASVVFMDSLGKLIGMAGKSMNDAEIAVTLYQLNRLASEEDVAIVLVHHTRKPPQGPEASHPIDVG